MRTNKFVATAVVFALCAAGAWAQAKPNVAVLSTNSPLYSTASIDASKGAPSLSKGEPLLIVASQDKKATIDGVPTLWYQVKTSEEASGWIPGSRMSFTSTAFTRSSFNTIEQYTAYLVMAARVGEKVVAIRSYEKVAKGDFGYFAGYHDGGLPFAIVWERNLDATPDEDYLPKGFPAELKPFVYYVTAPEIELVGDPQVASFKTLAKSLPKSYPEADGYYADMVDDDFPWYTPPEASYASGDYGYGEEEEYYDDEEYADESGIDPDYVEGVESFGFVQVGSTVILGKHDDVNGGEDWNSDMEKYVGTEAKVTELVGPDSNGLLVVKVVGNKFIWRVRNLAVKDRGEAGSYGYQVGDRVILGAHRYINEDRDWANDMAEYVGMEATITSLEGFDSSNCFLVHVDIDDGAWYWRAETMTPVE